MQRLLLWLSTVAFLAATPPANAHYHILLPQSASAARDKPVAFVVQFGHPFEHQLFDTSKPESLSVVLPDGKTADLRDTLQKGTMKNSEQKDVAVYRFQYTPQQRGDFTFVLKMPPIWMDEEHLFLKDTVRVVLHVLTQKGWDHSLDKGFEMVPLTRPYGLQASMVFQARAMLGGKPVVRALVEVERLNEGPLKDLPPDEQITRTVRTDPNGVATCTLTEPGWWCLTAQRSAGTLERQGKAFPVKERSTLWVYVKDRVRPKEGR